MFQVFILISCFYVTALATTDETCNDLQGRSINMFEAEKYTGKWYLSRYAINSWRTVHIHDNLLQCQSLDYQLNSDKNGYYIQTKNSIPPSTEKYYSDIFENFVNFTTKFYAANTSHMEMNGRAVPGDMRELVIMDTDYDNYAVEYICMSYAYKMLRLLTRTPTPSTESMNRILGSLLSSTILNNYDINDIQRSRVNGGSGTAVPRNSRYIR